MSFKMEFLREGPPEFQQWNRYRWHVQEGWPNGLNKRIDLLDYKQSLTQSSRSAVFQEQRYAGAESVLREVAAKSTGGIWSVEYRSLNSLWQV